MSPDRARPYQPLFDPPTAAATPGDAPGAADGRATVFDFWDEQLVLAVNVALATRRPLLLWGESGTGKSTAARAIADHLRRPFVSLVVTSRTQAQDLQYEVDHLLRLHHAQSPAGLRDPRHYVRPGPLWWAFDPAGAGRFVTDGGHPPADEVPVAPGQRAVVLIDEIDKAEVDVPNNLLVPLGSLHFPVVVPGGADVTVTTEEDQAPLVVITSNGERDLPRAFMRRCIHHRVPHPSWDDLIRLVGPHRRARDRDDRAVPLAVRDALRAMIEGTDRKVTPAAFIDAVRAVDALGGIGAVQWDLILELTGGDRQLVPATERDD